MLSPGARVAAASHGSIFIIRPFVFSATVRPESNNSVSAKAAKPRSSPSFSLSFAAPPPSRASIRHLPFSDFLPSSSLAHSSDSLYRGVHLARSSFFFFPPRFCPTEREEQRGREAGTGMASVSPLIYCSQHGGSMRANQPTPLVPRVFPDDQPSRSFSPRGLSRFLARGSLRPGRRISPGQSIRPTHVASNISPTIKLAWRGI